MTGSVVERKRTCFVIMPFGEKNDVDGQVLDFDDVYRFFLKKAVEGLGPATPIECVRCDEIAESGSIHEKMFEHIYHADVVVVDTTTANPNVFYELGVRHALRQGVTVLLRRTGTKIPFNIGGQEVVEYNPLSFRSIEQAKERIGKIISNGLREPRNDSPVHAVLDLNIWTDSKPIAETKKVVYAVRTNPERLKLGLITGDLQNVKGIDVWVNSENTNMEMARPYENSISGVIRNLGMSRSGTTDVDSIQQFLKEEMKKRGKNAVDPGEILVTEPGGLKGRGVKKIFHAASVYGEVGQGYCPVQNVARCVRNALNIFNEDIYKDLTTILIPLMGVRGRDQKLEDKIKALLDAAVNYLSADGEKYPMTVYFLVYTEKELYICQRLLDNEDRVVRFTPPVSELHTAYDPGAHAPTPDLSPHRPGTPTVPTVEGASYDPGGSDSGAPRRAPRAPKAT